jgi:NADP-dependent 3-hydroxy acid dehydrogenase YdfG
LGGKGFHVLALRFEGKVAFITGAWSGIGAAVAHEFSQQGANVVLLGRRIERLEQLEAAINALGRQALAIACDVTDRESLDEAVSKTIDTFGQIDVVLANAGFGVSGDMKKLETADFRRQFETNFFGVLETVYATLPHLEAAKVSAGYRE